MLIMLMIVLSFVGAAAALRLNVVGVAILSLAGFASTWVFGWLLSYPFLSSLIVAFGGSAAIQVGFFAGVLAQVWFGMRSAKMGQHDLPAEKAEVLGHLF